MQLYLIYTALACLGFGVGTTMMKHGMASEFPKVSLATFLKEWKSILFAILKNKVWVFGVIINITGGLFNVMALASGEITLVQPLVNLNIVITVLAGVLILKERISRLEISGVMVVILGAILLGMTVSAGGSPTMVKSMLMLLTGIVTVYCIAMAGYLSVSKNGFIALEFGLATIAGMLFGLGFAYIKVATITSDAILKDAGGLTASAVLSIVVSYPVIVVILANIFATIAQQGAFSHGRVALVSPVTTIFAVVTPVVSGAIVFGEQVGLLRGAGIALVMFGTALFSLKSGESEQAGPKSPA
jgi:drug/metabolite transporter (DMT)-like permease